MFSVPERLEAQRPGLSRLGSEDGVSCRTSELRREGPDYISSKPKP